MGDRADVAGGVERIGPLGDVARVHDDAVLTSRLRGHHRRLGAVDEVAWVAGVVRPVRDADRDGDLTRGVHGPCPEPLREPPGEPERVPGVAGRHDHRELLAAEAADDVARADERVRELGDRDEDLVADRVPADVVDALELVDVEHQERHRVAGTARAHQLRAETLVEVAVVVEAGERVGLRLVLEPGTDLRVVERERGRVAEPLRELELVLVERRGLTEPVDVERALQRSAGDERDRDERLGLGRRAGDEGHARVEMRLVREHGLAVDDRPPCDALPEGGARLHDLVLPLRPCEDGDQLMAGVVGLVDLERVVRHEIGERVGDAVEQRVEALLREDVVEDLRETPIRLDEQVGLARAVGVRPCRVRVTSGSANFPPIGSAGAR